MSPASGTRCRSPPMASSAPSTRRCGRSTPRHRPSRSPSKRRARSPAELDLQLGPVVVDLELELEVDQVGDLQLQVRAATVELDVVVPGEIVGERMQAACDLLTRETFLTGDLDQVHVNLLRG